MTGVQTCALPIFIFILAIILFEVILIHLFEVVEVVRAFRIDAFVEDEVLPLFLWDEGVAAVRAAQLHGREAAFSRGEPGVTDLAQHLPFGAVVFVEVGHGCVTAGTGAVLWNVALRAAVYGTDLFAIAFFDVGDEFPVSPSLPEVGDEGELVNLELLVFWGMGIVKSPLFKRDISADKINQPAVLLVKRLNE